MEIDLKVVEHLYRVCNLDSVVDVARKKIVQEKALQYLVKVQKSGREFNLMSAKAIGEVVHHLGDVWCAGEFLLPFFTLGDRVAFSEKFTHQVLDIGSGAGFPAIPLALLFPQVKFIAVESKKKKVNFLNEANEMLCLPNFKVHHGNIQEFSPRFPACFAMARGFARLLKIMQQCKKALKNDGGFLLLKGKIEIIEDEIREAQPLLKKKNVRVFPLTHPFLATARHLLCVEERTG